LVGQGESSILHGRLVERIPLGAALESFFVKEPNGCYSAMWVPRRVRAVDKGPEKQFALEGVGAGRP